MLDTGDKIPAFEAPTTREAALKASGLKGKPAVIYFYPKDDTSGCTSEAKDFSEHLAKFKKLGVRVLGVSPDSIASHEKFEKKHGLAHELAADEDKAMATAFGVWVEKSMYGRTYMGVERSTFLIDAKGRIARVWRKVKVKGHVEEVLKAAAELA